MTESIYGARKDQLEQTAAALLDEIQQVRSGLMDEQGMDPVEHLLFRVKSEESMREKCRRKGLPETEESALQLIHDAIGIRIVCSFVQDVYTMRDRIIRLPSIELVEEKDYIRHAKPNGYRSLHLIIRYNGFFVELQLRTISMDTWATLEHHLKYKKQVNGNTGLIIEELRRLAGELASTDISMQTIRDLIFDQKGE